MLAVSWGLRLAVSAQCPSPTPLPLPPCDLAALPPIPPLDIRVHLGTPPVALPVALAVVLGGPLGTQPSTPPFSGLPLQPRGWCSCFLPPPDLKLLRASLHTVSPACPLPVPLPQVPGKGWRLSDRAPLPGGCGSPGNPWVPAWLSPSLSPGLCGICLPSRASRASGLTWPWGGLGQC